MPHVMSQCFSYLKSQLTVRNCVKSLLLASAKKSWAQIASFIKNFIIVHFDQVRKFGSIYRLLNKEQFCDIIRSENLNIRFEEGKPFKIELKNQTIISIDQSGTKLLYRISKIFLFMILLKYFFFINQELK